MSDDVLDGISDGVLDETSDGVLDEMSDGVLKGMSNDSDTTSDKKSVGKRDGNEVGATGSTLRGLGEYVPISLVEIEPMIPISCVGGEIPFPLGGFDENIS